MKDKKMSEDNLSSIEHLELLDNSSILRLELMDQIIESKKQMESFLRNGYFMLGKARYIMGVQSVSMLQVPSVECSFETLYYTTTSEEPLEEWPSVSAAHFSIHRNKKLDQNISDDAKKEETKVRKRGSKAEDIEENSDAEVADVPQKELDPLNWFSALPPQSLRQAQQYFRQAIIKTAECATLQSKLDALNYQYKAEIKHAALNTFTKIKATDTLCKQEEVSS